MSFLLAAYQIPGFKLGVLDANQDMSAEATFQFTAVDVVANTGAGTEGPAAVAPAASGAAMLGILQNNPQVGEACEIVCTGVAKALLGATVAVDGLLMVGSGGKLIPATSGNFAVAKALQPGVNGSLAAVYLANYGKQ